MTHHDQTSQRYRKRLFLTALSLFFLESILVLSASVIWLLGQANADDFYYYLVLARHTAQGLGPTFDGMELTNGFHPLYLLLLTPLATLPIQAPAFLIKAGLILLLLFHNATGVVLGLGFERLKRRDVGWLAALTWLLNPWALAITLHGVEAPIATFFWAIIIFWVYLSRRNDAMFSLKEAAGLGALLGLAVLARTDGLMLALGIGLSELYRTRRDAAPQRRHRLIALTVMAGVTLLLTLPWWLWNITTFGMLIQVSGKAIFLNMHGFDWLDPANIIGRISFTTLLYISRFIAYNLSGFLLLGYILLKKRFSQIEPPPSTGLSSLLRHLDFALLAVLAIAGWYAGWEWMIQNWYLLSTTLTVTLLLGLLIERATAPFSRMALQQAIGIVVLVNLLFLFGTYNVTGFGYPRQAGGYYVAQWINQETEEDAIIGVWNSGIVGYFSERPVINLDGVVNNSLYHYRLEQRTISVAGMMPYIRRRNITYVTDYERINFPDPESMGLTQVYQSPEHGFPVFQPLPE